MARHLWQNNSIKLKAAYFLKIRKRNIGLLKQKQSLSPISRNPYFILQCGHVTCRRCCKSQNRTTCVTCKGRLNMIIYFINFILMVVFYSPCFIQASVKINRIQWQLKCVHCPTTFYQHQWKFSTRWRSGNESKHFRYGNKKNSGFRQTFRSSTDNGNVRFSDFESEKVPMAFCRNRTRRFMNIGE